MIDESQNRNQQPSNQSPNSREVSTEEILKKNPQLWDLYQSGRFEIVQSFDSRDKKIVLKEKTSKQDAKYTVTKFKVPVSTAQGSDDGHILLVSFSNSQIEPNQQIQVESTQYTYDETIGNKPIEHVIKPITANEPTGYITNSNTHYNSEEQKIVGPGSGLVARLVEGSSSCSQSDIFEDDEAISDEPYVKNKDRKKESKCKE
jgi:hypothetical protein